MLRLCLVFWKSEPHYAYKRYAYKRKNMYFESFLPTKTWLEGKRNLNIGQTVHIQCAAESLPEGKVVNEKQDFDGQARI